MYMEQWWQEDEPPRLWRTLEELEELDADELLQVLFTVQKKNQYRSDFCGSPRGPNNSSSDTKGLENSNKSNYSTCGG